MTQTRRILLADIMDTVVVDPFFHGGIESFFGMSLQTLFKSVRPGVWVRFERGEIDEREYYETFFADDRGIDGEALMQWMAERYRIVPGMETLLTEARDAGVEIYALSNYPVWWKVIERELKLSRFLQWRFVSCMTGVRKPDPEAYAGPLRALATTPQSCLFTDDRKENVDAAEALGMHGHVFDGTAGLRATLSAIGWLPQPKT